MSDTKPFILFILGGPGSGKGTQCTRLVKDFQFVHLSAGDLLREEMAREGSEYSELISTYIKEGNVVPVEITLALLKAAMDRTPGRPFLIDGYPRELGQATEFEKQIAPCRAVFYYKCSEETMRSRLLNRGLSSGRTDDNEETIVKRLVTFRKTSYPVIKHYQERELVVEISTEYTPDNVYQLTHEAVAKLLSDEALVPKFALTDSQNLETSNQAQKEVPEVEAVNQNSIKATSSSLDTEPTVTSTASNLPEDATLEEVASTHSQDNSKRDSTLPEEVIHYEEDGAPVHPAHETQLETSLHEAVAEPTPLEPSELKSEPLLEVVNSADQLDGELPHSDGAPLESQAEEKVNKENENTVPQSVDASFKPSESLDSSAKKPIAIKSNPEQEDLTDIKPDSDKFVLATPIVLPTNLSEVETVFDVLEPEPSLAETTETKPESVLVEPEILPAEMIDSNVEPVLLVPAASLEEPTKAESIKYEPEASTKEPAKAESIKLEPGTSTEDPAKAESIKLEPEASIEEPTKAESIKHEPETSIEEPAKPESALAEAEGSTQANATSKQVELELLPEENPESDNKSKSPEVTKPELLPLELSVAKDETEQSERENLETQTPVQSSSNIEETSNIYVNPMESAVEKSDPISFSKHRDESTDILEHTEEIDHTTSEETSKPYELKPSNDELHDDTVSTELSGQELTNVLDDSHTVTEQTPAINPDHIEASQPDVEKVVDDHQIDAIASKKAPADDDLVESFANEIQFSDSKDLETIADLPDFTGTLSKKSTLEEINSEIPADSVPKSQPKSVQPSHDEEKPEVIPEIVEDSSNDLNKTTELEGSSSQKAIDNVELNDPAPQQDEIRVSQLTDASPASVVAPRRTSSVLDQVEPKVTLDTPLPPARNVSLPSSQASPEATAVSNNDKVPELQPPMPSLAKEDHAKVEVPSSSMPTPLFSSHPEVNQSVDPSPASPDITSPEMPVPAKLVSEKLTELPTAPTPDNTSSPSASTLDPKVKTHKKKATCAMM